MIKEVWVVECEDADVAGIFSSLVYAKKAIQDKYLDKFGYAFDWTNDDESTCSCIVTYFSENGWLIQDTYHLHKEQFNKLYDY